MVAVKTNVGGVVANLLSVPPSKTTSAAPERPSRQKKRYQLGEGIRSTSSTNFKAAGTQPNLPKMPSGRQQL